MSLRLHLRPQCVAWRMGSTAQTGEHYGEPDAARPTLQRGRGVICMVADPIRRTRTRGFDARVAASARVYDYWLGGKDSFAADRIAGEAAIDACPAIRFSARAQGHPVASAVMDRGPGTGFPVGRHGPASREPDGMSRRGNPEASEFCVT
jgi:S-adenosyl methyltransferase